MKKIPWIVMVVSAWVVADVLLLDSQEAQAGWRHHRYWHHHEPFEVLPSNFISVSVGGFDYFYSEGYYYRPCPGGYVLVPAPVGACVPMLPPGCQPIMIDNVVYQYYDGVFYQPLPSGQYSVVPLPIARKIPIKALPVDDQPMAEQPVEDQQKESTLVVNIPNKNGSYTPVTLQLAANGMYIGPQGEVYPTKPSEEQLKAMYGK